jgi:hypothetical protein
MNIREIKIGQALSANEVLETFQGNKFSAVRISKEQKTIAVLVNYENHVLNFWRGNTLFFEAVGNDLKRSQNRYLLNAQQEGFEVFLLERYTSGPYYFQGAMDVRGVDTFSRLNMAGESEIVDYLKLHPVRFAEGLASLESVLTVEIEIDHEDTYWNEYLSVRSSYFGVFDAEPEAKREARLSGIWRMYATNIIEDFVSRIESRSPELIIPEYDLERGSIKGTLTVMASVATILGSGVSAVAKYPEAKESWPILQHDVREIVVEAAKDLQRRFPNALVSLRERKEKNPKGKVFPALGPAYNRRKDEDFEES